MEADIVAVCGGSDAHHGVGIICNGEVDRFVDQAGDVALEMCHSLRIEFFHVATPLVETATTQPLIGLCLEVLAEKW